MHTTLERQIKKYLKNQKLISGDCKQLLEAISLTYEHFDEDRIFMDRSLEISTKEYHEINEELKQNIETEKRSKQELEARRKEIMNLLEEARRSRDELKKMNEMLAKRKAEVESLKTLSDELVGQSRVDEIIEIVNHYLFSILDCSAVTFLIIGPPESGEVEYDTILKEGVSEGFLDKMRKKLIGYMSGLPDTQAAAALKTIRGVLPRISGQPVDNSGISNLKSDIIFPVRAGGHLLGLIQVASGRINVRNTEKRSLIEAMVGTLALSLDRLYTLILSHRSKTLSLVKSLNDGVIMIDQNREVSFMNPAATRFTGMSTDGFLLDNFYEIFEEAKLEILVNRSLDQGKISSVQEVSIIGRHYEIAVTPVRDNQNIVGAAVILHDITHLKELDRMKTEFVSVASHQLRTPLTAIKLFTEMLVRGDVGELADKQKEYLSDIYQSTERMTRLVNDLLNVSRMESGRLRVSPRPEDLRRLIEGTITEVAPLADLKKVTIDFRAGRTELPRIPIDSSLFRQVIHNLLVNSIRYAKPHGGQVKVTLELSKPDNFMVSVEDNGIGIPKNRQYRIFEKFFRADNAVKAVTEGTGLGLYFSKMIVEASGGKIWFESAINKGTKFFVQMPLCGMKTREGERGLAIS